MDRAELEAWAREAGKLVLPLYYDVERAAHRRKEDRSWVTAADEMAETLLRQRIGSAYPHHTMMGEEQGGSGSTSGELWAIDPIDGTEAFVNGLPVWGVSIGLLRDGRPVAGCFYLPVLDECYSAGSEGPATYNGQPLSLGQPRPEHESWIAVTSNAHRRYQISFPGKTRAMGSTAAHICYVARGQALGALLGHAKLWDLAGALAVLERAGGGIWQLSGSPLDYAPLLAGQLSAEPLLATTEASMPSLLQQISLR